MTDSVVVPTEVIPQYVQDWYDAKRAHVAAVEAYNARLAFVREHEPFGTSVNIEYQLMEAAERKARELLVPMYAGLAEFFTLPATPQEQDQQSFMKKEICPNCEHQFESSANPYINQLRAANAQKPESAVVPEGWHIERSGDRIVVRQSPGGAGYAAERAGQSGIAESVLYLLADSILSAHAGPSVPQPE